MINFKDKSALNVILAITLSGLLYWIAVTKPWIPLFVDIKTNSGEEITVLLEDSTQLSLSGGSMANINIDETQREISLLDGKFQIETSALCVRNLPIAVITPHGLLSPSDSLFNLELTENSANIRVQKGEVSLVRNGEIHSVVANQSVHFTADRVLKHQ